MIILNEPENTAKMYRAWVNNRVSALLLTIQRSEMKDMELSLKHEFFLEEIEHHFVDSHAGVRVWRAFNYLRRYLKCDSDAKASHRIGALRMLGLIYERLGFDGKKIFASV